MGSKGERHLKTYPAPITWLIPRKGIKWITRPLPGAHKISLGLPLTLVLRKMLSVATTSREAKKLLNTQEVLVDRIREKEARRCVGVMDTLSIIKTGQHFRLLLNERAQLVLCPITEAESRIKPYKLISKRLFRGKVQLNLSNGKNLVVDKDVYKIGSTLLLELPENKIKEILEFEPGCIVYLTGGSHIGSTGKITEIRKDVIMFIHGDSKSETLKSHAIVIGKDKPLITLL